MIFAIVHDLSSAVGLSSKEPARPADTAESYGFDDHATLKILNNYIV